ncbi:transcriptional regulator [Comamonas serinivorans]|uniref:Transcriptional regulator n=1 Tax=Comamonas serinivorans TaxID=1082851 RepID=A0A1Y0ELG7_9BURK|nr:helix-turn-helix transcriptional regulator [Comamonas serinivorans]ARU04152.1 transcriptional regulator [Comamonas serinivorans]
MRHTTATSLASSPTVPNARSPFGDHLRHWRLHRRLSQQDLALEANVSTRHLSCVETGRAMPSREMILRLADRLAVPLRERNALLVAAGFSPTYGARPLDHPELAAARQAVEQLLKAHQPYPALAVDRHWNLVMANDAAQGLMAGVAPHLLAPPLNVLRLSLHPDGLAPRIVNLAQWRAHVLERLAQQINATADAQLLSLRDELAALSEAAASHPESEEAPNAGMGAGIVVPLVLRTPGGTLRFISTTTIFGTPVDVTLQDLAIESFFPADAATQAALARA